MTTLEAFEELPSALDDLAKSLYGNSLIGGIIDMFPTRIREYIKNDPVNLLMAEFGILYTYAVVLADVTVWILEKL